MLISKLLIVIYLYIINVFNNYFTLIRYYQIDKYYNQLNRYYLKIINFKEQI